MGGVRQSRPVGGRRARARHLQARGDQRASPCTSCRTAADIDEMRACWAHESEERLTYIRLLEGLRLRG